MPVYTSARQKASRIQYCPKAPNLVSNSTVETGELFFDGQDLKLPERYGSIATSHLREIEVGTNRIESNKDPIRIRIRPYGSNKGAYSIRYSLFGYSNE